MADEPITHRSAIVTPSNRNAVLEGETNNNGVKCTWNGRTNQNTVDRYADKITGFTLWWQFDWSELKETGVDEVSGHITVTSQTEWFPPQKINFNFTETTGKAETNIYIGARDYTCSVVYEYTLFPRRSSVKEVETKEVLYEEMFLPSPKNDTILVVDGKKLHVNKAFLSYHSDFFNSLFSSNFKEGRMDEIPIEDVTFEDFGLIMSTIYPMITMYPNDNNVEKLLELADRFMLPSIIRHVEYHLIHHSKIDGAKTTWMADAYGMTELLEKCVLEYTTIEKKLSLRCEMADKPITHQSEYVIPSKEDDVLEEEIDNNGVKSTWNGRTNQSTVDRYNKIKFTGLTFWWQFDWSELKKTGVDELSGHITVSSWGRWFPPQKINFNFVETTEKVETNIYIGARDDRCSVVYEYTLFPRRSSVKEVKIKEVFYEEMFLPSPKNDTILVVDGKKLHVNKAFLSYHSDFFNALFSSNFKEGRMDEIPIEDVTFEDFGLVMSIIYPRAAHPNDSNVDKLLELADRFIIPAVIGHVEYHLLHISKISYEKMTWLADQYGMPQLLDKCIHEINTVEKFRTLNASPDYKKLSDNTKSRVLDRLAEFI
ncbi:unnamed protein product [Caenorhabditis brenneri]